MMKNTEPNISEEYFQGWGFAVKIESNVYIEKTSPVEDFDIYNFITKDKNTNFLNAYVGNHPSFMKEMEINVIIENTLINDLNAKMAEWKDSNGLFYKEVLVNLSRNERTPQYIHFWYKGINESLKSIADEIILSVKTIEAA